MGIGCCCCIDVQLVIQQPFKHAASFTCLYVHHQVSKLPAAQHSKGLSGQKQHKMPLWAQYAMLTRNAQATGFPSTYLSLLQASA